MSKLGPRNPIIYRSLIIIISIIFVIGIIVFAVIKIKESNSLNYDIGERDLNKTYNDIIIKNYDEYKEVVNKYKIVNDLKPEDFTNNYYLVSFQEYDSCSERKRKQVGKTSVDDNTIEIEFKRYNKCGWCKSHIILYLIKIDKIKNVEGVKINYAYTDDKTVNCGNALD